MKPPVQESVSMLWAHGLMPARPGASAPWWAPTGPLAAASKPLPEPVKHATLFEGRHSRLPSRSLGRLQLCPWAAASEDPQSRERGQRHGGHHQQSRANSSRGRLVTPADDKSSSGVAPVVGIPRKPLPAAGIAGRGDLLVPAGGLQPGRQRSASLSIASAREVDRVPGLDPEE